MGAVLFHDYVIFKHIRSTGQIASIITRAQAARRVVRSLGSFRTASWRTGDHDI